MPWWRQTNPRLRRSVFCSSCSFLVYKQYDRSCQGCPTYHVNELWQGFNVPCLSCQLAAITYQNPWINSYNKLLEVWLNVVESDDSEVLDPEHIPATRTHQSPQTQTYISEHDMIDQWIQAFETSFSKMRVRASRAETRIVFENLSQSTLRRLPLGQSDINSLSTWTTNGSTVSGNTRTSRNTIK